MAMNFPNSPEVDDLFTAGEYTYKWDGEKWVSQNASGGGGGIIDILYANLVSLMTGDTLVPEQKYRITDYCTTYTMPNTSDPFVGENEPLLVTAFTTSELYVEAFSEMYPQDIIHYTTNNNCIFPQGGVATADTLYGVILYREDTLQNNKIFADFRHSKWRRWLDTDSGQYINLTDVETNGMYLDHFTFSDGMGNSMYALNTSSNSFGGTALDDNNAYVGIFLINSVFMGNADNNKFNGTFLDNTLAGYISNNIVGGVFNNNKILTTFSFNYCSGGFGGNVIGNNVVGSAFSNNVIDNNFSGNIVGDNFSNNKIGNTFTNNTTGYIFTVNTIESNCYNNTFSDSCIGNVIGLEFQNNTISDNFTFNVVGASSQGNTIYAQCEYNNFGNFFTNNTVGVVCSNNIIGGSCGGNYFGDYCSNNNIGSYCAGNSFDDYFVWNNIGNGCNTNNIGAVCDSNVIGNYFETNTIGVAFQNNTFGQGCTANLIGANFYGNSLGSYFSDNTISLVGDPLEDSTFPFQNNIITGNGFSGFTLCETDSISGIQYTISDGTWYTLSVVGGVVTATAV